MDAWLDRMYARYGVRYLVAGGVVVLSLILFFMVPLASWPPARYEGLSFGQFVHAVLIALVYVPITVLVALVASRRTVQTVSAWHAGDRSAQRAAELRVVAFRHPRRLCTILAAFGVVFVTPTAVLLLALPSHHTTFIDFAELSVSFQAELAAVIMSGYVLLELVWRPVRASLPATPKRSSESGRLTNRLVLPLLAIVLTSCIYVGALFSSHLSAGAGGLFVIIGVALGITAVWAVVLVPMLSVSVLKPIRDLTAGHRAVGAGELTHAVPVTTEDELGELATSFNAMLADLRRHTEELRASRERIVAAADGERRRIERDIHDGAQQQLVMMNLKLGMVARSLHTDPAAAAATIEEVRDDLGRALSELRDLAHGLYPQLLETEGLPGALRDATERAPIPTDFDCDGASRYRPELEAAVYFCCLEALQNAAKHAGEGAHARLRLGEQDGVLSFEVTDDGRGQEGELTGAGIQNMTDRIGALGGELHVRSAAGIGTTVVGAVPIGQH